MGDQDAFERILASLHDATLDDALWPATSALIDAACGVEGNALLVGAGPPDDVRVLFAQAYYRGRRSADLEREYLEVYHPIDERVPRVRQLPDSRLVHITDLYTAEELKTSPTYNEMMPRTSMQDSLNVRLDGPDGSHITWAISDPVGPRGWEDPQLALIQGLLPHLRQFIRVRQAMVSAGVPDVVTSALLNNMRVGVIYLDQRGRIVEVNDRARTMLRQGDTLADRDGALFARIPADRARLERLVAAALPTASAPAVSGSMALRRPSVLLPFVVHVKPVSVRQMDFGARSAAVLVLITEPGHVSRIDPALVAETLGLTLMESRMAAWLAEGRTISEIAVALGLTNGAVRWHLHQIYSKQGLSRQADLVRLVLSVATFV